MTVTYQTIILTLLIPTAITMFDCEETTDISSQTCPELQCNYEEAFETQEKKKCRCKIIISDLPLPKHTLDYNLFKTICAKQEDRLTTLWIIDAELEYMDNKIFEKYPNLKDLKLSGNNVQLNFTREAEKLIKLDLSNNGINSIQSDAFDNLKSLKMINASFNRIDRINFCLKELKELEEVYLNNNELTRISKHDFDHLSKMKVLNLAHNYLTSIDSYLFLQNLEELYLNNNKLININQQEFTRLVNLRILNIGYNLINDLGNNHDFTKLEEFHCENNQLREINRKISNLQSLRFVNISNNEIRTIGPNTFSKNNKLEVIDCNSNRIGFIDSDNFQSFKNISYLNLNNNSLTEAVISCDNLEYLTQLNILYLSNNQISEIYNCTFSKLKNLSKLSLLMNKLEQLPNSAFSALSKLQELNLAANQITEIPAGIFNNLIELRKLNISHNNLTQFDLNRLDNNHKITEFDIKYNNLDKLNLNSLKNKLTSVKVLDFDTNLIKCDEYSGVLNYFEDNAIVFKSCPKTEMCCNMGLNKKTVAFITVSGAVCLFAIVGLFVFICKICLTKKYSSVHLIPVYKSN